MLLPLFLQLFATALLCFTSKAEETQQPSLNCQEGGFAISHLSPQCDLNQFNGLNNHAPAQVLYEIVAEATTVTNNTFYKNGTNVSCLFNGTNFVLNGLGPLNINVQAEGSMSKIIPTL